MELFDFDGTFFRGMKSDTDPAQLPVGYYWGGMNVLNVGGMLSCRPGYRCVVSLPEGKLQGGTYFRPRFGVEQLVVCIDGAIYVSPWPFISFKQLSNVLMSPSAKQVFWCQTTQSARRKTDDLGSALEVIDPRNVLFIQDGGNTAPAWYDGSDSGHLRNIPFQTPLGGPMAWIGDRLWVAFQNFVRASDISNPFSFREDIYLGGVSRFAFKGEVTALAKTPSLVNRSLIVFTNDNAELIRAYIRDRSAWPTTDEMQAEIFDVGTPSQRSVVSHFGRLSWFSGSGIVMFDSAKASQITSRLPLRDSEMSVSKTRLSEDLSLVAGAAFGKYLLMSVPAEDNYNKHTWVLNDAAMETVSDDSGQSWASWWMGTRPVEWIYGSIAGQDRIFHVSTDEDGQNRLWEAFRSERLDNGCPITWTIESRGYFGQASDVKKLPGQFCKFNWAELALVGIEEDLDIAVFYAGGLRGQYKNIMAKKISVERGNIRPAQQITATTNLFAFKPQSRRVKTEDATQQSTAFDSGSCPVESEANENLDESFQLLIVGHGPAAIRWIRVQGTDEADDKNGDNKACESETQFNAIRFDGAGVQSDDPSGLAAELAAKVFRRYTSTQTVQLQQDDFFAIGVGSAESIVSQAAADRVATVIATKLADRDLVNQLPNTYSIGEGL